MRWFGVLLGLVLCQCASQHETREFAPFFKTDPPGYLSTSYIYERAELESKGELNQWQQKRLQDLYELELRQLSRESGKRVAALNHSIQKLSERNQELTDRIESIKRDVSTRNTRQPAESTPVFVDPDFKKEYFQAYRLWNRDENDEALVKAIQLSKSARFEDLTEKERFKALNLQFRIALDLQNLEVGATAYAAMRDLDSCAQETADAGFLIALTYLGAGDPKRGRTVFEEQCDPDETPPNRVKRHYWNARFREASGVSSPDEYEAIVDSGVPGYYFFLASSRLNRPLRFPSLDARTYLLHNFKTTGSVAEWLNEAETLLKFNLRVDASVYLQRAIQSLKDSAGPEDVPTLLYIAHLFQAAGTQLEALKVYAIITEIGQGMEVPFAFDFINEMFPTPHRDTVNRVSEEWNVDPDFIYAIMRQESAFNPGAVSPANARGLMQMMPFLANQISKAWRYDSYFSKRTLFFARENLKFATFHLQQLQTQMPHPALIAASYNAGARRVANWWKRTPGLPLDIFVELIPIVETRNYVKLVLRNYVFYRLIRGDGKIDSKVVPMRLPDPTGMQTSEQLNKYRAPDCTSLNTGFCVFPRALEYAASFK